MKNSDPYRIDTHQVVVTIASGLAAAALVGIQILIYGLTPAALVGGVVVALAAGGVGWVMAGGSRSIRQTIERSAQTDAVIRESQRLRRSA